MKSMFLALALVSSSSMAQAQVIKAGQWDMRIANEVRDPQCDRYQRLTVDSTPQLGSFALLEDKLAGTCYVFVPPNPRFIRLQYAGTSCGSLKWKGRIEGQGEMRYETQEVLITDHRPRVCRDVVPAQVILEIKDEQLGNQVWYSSKK